MLVYVTGTGTGTPNCWLLGSQGLVGPAAARQLDAFATSGATACGPPGRRTAHGTAPAPRISPAQLAAAFWDVVPLPVPHPRVPPGSAITGRPAYLLTGDTDAPAHWTLATPIGPLTIAARGTYTVDWGDGSPPSGPYDTTGAPWPAGTITHVYDVSGSDTVTVVETWTATWSLGAATGTLRALRTTGTLPALAVRQVQAVVTGEQG